jgi:hypothetical protein
LPFGTARALLHFDERKQVVLIDASGAIITALVRPASSADPIAFARSVPLGE